MRQARSAAANKSAAKKMSIRRGPSSWNSDHIWGIFGAQNRPNLVTRKKAMFHVLHNTTFVGLHR
jgi:hypothetical protein